MRVSIKGKEKKTEEKAVIKIGISVEQEQLKMNFVR